MSTVLITGSADGLGQMAAERLVAQGHDVVLHARNDGRAAEALAAVPGARTALSGDLASIEQTRALAEAANAAGPFEAVVHNAAVGYRESRAETVDGLEHVFAINVLAPFLLTALIARPRRLIYLSSGMHSGGDLVLDDLQWTRRRWNGSQAYSDSKLMDAMLAFAVARLWPDVSSNAVTPGWVATKMGGSRSTRRPRGRGRDAGVARGRRRPGRHRHGSLSLPSPAARPPPRGERPRRAGRTARRTRGDRRGRPACVRPRSPSCPTGCPGPCSRGRTCWR